METAQIQHPTVYETLACHCFAVDQPFANATNEIDLLKTNDDVYHFLVKHVSKREFKDASPFVRYKVWFTGMPKNTFYKTDLDDNGQTDLVIDGYGVLLAVMAFGKRYRSYHLDTDVGYDSPTDLVGIDSITQTRKLIVQRQNRGIDTLVYRFNGFVEYTPLPDTNLSFDSLVWNAYWNGDLRVQLKVYRNLSATYSTWPERWSNEEVTFVSGIYSRKTFHQLEELLQYMRPQQMKKRFNNGLSHTDHCITHITLNGQTVTIDDYGADGTFGLRQLYELMHAIRDTLQTHR